MNRYIAQNVIQPWNMMPNDTYHTVSEIADQLKVAEATVRHWIKATELRAISIGKGWRVAGEDLERFLQQHETVARAPREGSNASQVSGKT